jgi:acetyl-CoA/propionyl-CoA carboxylase, biotin carboxylase, biotin carboxyl carrier protein
MTMFSTVLIANRGEIAVRLIGTLRRMGIRTVAVYSDADAGARHVREADMSVRLGPAAARDSYLRIDAIIAAALETGAEAIHPGYGFVSENADFADACAAAGIVFIGPPASAIRAMGDKISAKAMVAEAGVRVVPGSSASGMADAELIAAAHKVGFPILLKPSAGGGGKGMRLVASGDGDALGEAIASARREALSSFGDDTLLVERFIERPRHIEVQVLADTHGNVVHFGERECSLQRRHQKIIEEAPSLLITPELRAAMGAQAVAAAQACSYVGAGTIEMIVSSDRPDEFFFMEMNTRLQVEHPVTEMVYGVDLVEWQVRVAAGEHLPWNQADLVPNGHAVEARLYAESPARGFLPTGGVVLGLREPTGDGVRVDSGLAVGSVIGSDYDPMLAKVIAHGEDRETALRRLDRALADTVVAGVGTNIGFLRALINDADVVAGRLHTGLVDDHLEALVGDGLAPPEICVAAAIARLGSSTDRAGWSDRRGWRLGGPAWIQQRLLLGAEPTLVALRSAGGDRWEVSIHDCEPVTVAVTGHPDGFTIAGPAGSVRIVVVQRAATFHLANGHGSWTSTIDTSSTRQIAGSAGRVGPVRSPMPGTVLEVRVVVGEVVVAGQALAVVEAMKMEHTLVAAADGVVLSLDAHAGQSVTLDQIIVTIGPPPTPSTGAP